MSGRPNLSQVAAAGLGLLAVGTVAFVGSRETQPVPVVKVESPAVDAPSAPKANGKVVVHVGGMVRAPGVVTLAAGARVHDAIRQAGGAKPGADLEALNLAALLEDGSRLTVPRRAQVAVQPPPRVAVAPRPRSTPQPMYGAFSSANYEVRPVSPPAPSAEEAPAVGRATPRAEAESAPREADSPAVINLNTATAEQLDTLPGVGPATAESILAYRKENGGFKSIDELLAVRGIGPKKLEKMRPFLAL